MFPNLSVDFIYSKISICSIYSVITSLRSIPLAVLYTWMYPAASTNPAKKLRKLKV